MRSGMTKAQLLASLFSVLPLLKPAEAASYNMVKEYAGSGFFNDWTFYDHCMYIFHCSGFPCSWVFADDNLTNGDVMCVLNQPHGLLLLVDFFTDSFQRRSPHHPSSHTSIPTITLSSKSTTLPQSRTTRNATRSVLVRLIAMVLEAFGLRTSTTYHMEYAFTRCCIAPCID
jgi:hypothetical protein